MIRPKQRASSTPNPLLDSPAKHLVNPLCRDCALWKTCSSVCIPGRGAVGHPIDALFVGQAPGRVEDEQGRCFAGLAGERLEAGLKASGLRSFKIRLENVCRCAPPGDRKPHAGEIKQCVWRVHHAIERHEPKVIVPLGDIALRALTGRKGIDTYAGRPFRHEGQWFFPVIHPSAVLHQPRRGSAFEAQLKAVMQWLRSGGRRGRHGQDWRLLTTVEEIEAHYEDLLVARDLTAFDYETVGTDPAQPAARVRLVSYCNEKGRARAWPLEAGGIIAAEVAQCACQLHAAWLASSRPKAAHTATFEWKWARFFFGARPVNLAFDTKLAHHLLHETDEHSLSHLSGEYTTFAGYDDAIEDYKARVGDAGEAYATAPITRLAMYSCGDAEATYLSARALEGELREDPESVGLARYLDEVLLPAVPAVAAMEHRGLYISQEAADRIGAVLDERVAALTVEIHAQPGVASWWRGKRSVNLGSDAQVRDLFFKHLKLKTSVRTKSGLPSTGKDALGELADDHPVVPLLRAWREANYLGTKVGELLRFREPDGLVHPHFQMANARTLRLATISPQVQNLAKIVVDTPDGEIGVRSLVTPRGPNRVLVEADYSQLEMRLMAELAGDPAWLEAFERGDDLHRLTAADMFGLDPETVTKAQRAAGKALNFGINYGKTAAGLAFDLGIRPAEAERRLASFWRQHRPVQRWIGEQHRLARERGYVTNRLGAVRRLPDAQGDEEARAYDEALRQAQNFPVTSLGAGITMIAMMLVDNEAARRRLDGGLINQNHDALLADVLESELDAWVDILHTCMVDRIHELIDLKVRLVVDVCVGTDWGAMKPIGR